MSDMGKVASAAQSRRTSESQNNKCRLPGMQARMFAFAIEKSDSTVRSEDLGLFGLTAVTCCAQKPDRLLIGSV